MSTDKTKVAIVKKIMSIEDALTLDSIKDLIDLHQDPRWREMPEEVKASMDRGLAQLESGEGIPHEEVMRKYRTWLTPSSGRRKRKRASTK